MTPPKKDWIVKALSQLARVFSAIRNITMKSYMINTALSAAFAITPLLTANAGNPPSTPELSRPSAVDIRDQVNLKIQAQQAAREGNIDALKRYLDQGNSPNIVTDRGDTLLILATYYGHKDAVELLLNHKETKIDVSNKMGFTALGGALFRNHDDIAILLLDHGANVNNKNTAKQTPLMFAAQFNRPRIARELILRGANVEAKDVLGNTPLSLAQKDNHPQMISILNAGLSERLWVKPASIMADRDNSTSLTRPCLFTEEVAFD